MAQITLQGNPLNTNGELPAVGTKAPDFKLTKSDLSDISVSEYAGKKVVLNIFPSLDTPTCATSVRTFNAKATELDNTVVLCISKDLPFAHARFCAAEGLENVVTAAEMRRDATFANAYGVDIVDGPLAGLMARAVVVLNENGEVVYNELVGEIADEPNYDAALAALK